MQLSACVVHRERRPGRTRGGGGQGGRNYAEVVRFGANRRSASLAGVLVIRGGRAGLGSIYQLLQSTPSTEEQTHRVWDQVLVGCCEYLLTQDPTSTPTVLHNTFRAYLSLDSIYAHAGEVGCRVVNRGCDTRAYIAVSEPAPGSVPKAHRHRWVLILLVLKRSAGCERRRGPVSQNTKTRLASRVLLK